MQQNCKPLGQVLINQTSLPNLGNITQQGVINSQKLVIWHHLFSQRATGCHDNLVILLAESLNQPHAFGERKILKQVPGKSAEMWDLQACM